METDICFNGKSIDMCILVSTIVFYHSWNTHLHISHLITPCYFLSIGFSVGLVLSNILFNVITSAVKSILVCFAGSPDELQQNHPDCSHIMREAWKESFPGLVDYVADTNNSNIGRICRSPNAHGLRFKRESLESLYV